MTDPRTLLQESLGTAYTLERELGGGGMSRVYLAQENALGRRVVVKVIAPELAEGLSAERFTREVKFAARLQQANIVPVLTAGAAGGLPYYTMPFVDGLSLRARLAQGPIPLGDALSILRDVARALTYAHAQGVVHRDIKPENILLSGGAAVVTDFGIAKAISASRTQEGTGESSSTMLTQTGTSIGTPAYMAPEQAVGAPVDHRADLYAWGTVAYELLAGAHPFAGRTSAQQLIAAHIAETPAPLGGRNPGVPPQIAELVMQCLQKDPAQRPENAGLLVEGLGAAATPSGERPHPAGTGVRPRTVAVVIGAIAVVAILAGVLYAWKGRSAPAASRSVVVIPFDNLGAPDDAYFADGVTEEIASQIARIPGMQVIARASVQQFRGSAKSPQQIAQALGAEYALSGSVRWARTPGSAGANGETQVRIVPALVRASTGVQVWGEPFQERLTDVFKVQADVAEQVASALSVTLGSAARENLRRPDSRNAEARDAQLRGRALLRLRGLANLRDAVQAFRQAIALDSSYARAWAGYSSAYGYLPVYFDSTVTALDAFAEAERAARRAVALDSLLPEAQSALAVALFHNFRFREALSTIDRAIALDPSSASAYKERAEILLSQGRVAEAEAPLRRAIALDPLVPVLHATFTVWFTATGQNDSAIALANRVIAMDPVSPFWQFTRIGTLEEAQPPRLPEVIDACLKLGMPARFCHTAWPGFLDPAHQADGLATLAAIARDSALSRFVPAALQGALYAHLGVPDSAFARLRVAMMPGHNEFYGIINSVWFDPLKTDPRWDQIVGTVQRQ